MEVITMTTEAFQAIVSKIDNLSEKLGKVKSPQPLSETWLDVADTIRLLKISKRTLSYYRTNRILSFSQINGKIYFKASDIEELLNSHYVKSLNK